MELTITQRLKNGFLGGPKNKSFSLHYNNTYYTLKINQLGMRQIIIASSEGGTIKDMFEIYFSLETLLMLLDGQFYPIISVFENDIEITRSLERRILPSYYSADFMVGAGNNLVDFDMVLELQLFLNWLNLREELDLIHKMVLYCLSNVEMPKDMQCAFMTEAFEGLGELIHKKEPQFILPKIKSGESKLQKYLLTIITRFGALIFEKEIQYGLKKFIQILVNSRNRIAHIKSKQNRTYLIGEENVIYLLKLSLLYRVILFHLLNIPENLYKNSLLLRIQAINRHEATQKFLNQLSKYDSGF